MIENPTLRIENSNWFKVVYSRNRFILVFLQLHRPNSITTILFHAIATRPLKQAFAPRAAHEIASPKRAQIRGNCSTISQKPCPCPAFIHTNRLLRKNGAARVGPCRAMALPGNGDGYGDNGLADVEANPRMPGRGERIRTSDSCVPNAVLYQAELHPDFQEAGRDCISRAAINIAARRQRTLIVAGIPYIANPVMQLLQHGPLPPPCAPARAYSPARRSRG